MALGGFWGRLWLVLGAPEGLLGGVLASDKPISTIKTALPSFDTLFFLVVVVAAAAVLVVLVVAVVVSLLPCNFSSIRLGGMRRAIEYGGPPAGPGRVGLHLVNANGKEG